MNNKGMTSMALGITAAVAVGTAAYMMNQKQHSKKLKKVCRSAKKTLNTVEGVIEGVSSMMS